jgi:hypothetical protein
MKKLAMFAALCSLTLFAVGCDNSPAAKKANSDIKAVNEAGSELKKDIDDAAKEDKADVDAAVKETDADIKAEEKADEAAAK